MTKEQFDAIRVGAKLTINNVKYVAERLEGKHWELRRLKDKASVWLKKEWIGPAYKLEFYYGSHLRRQFATERYVKSFSVEGKANATTLDEYVMQFSDGQLGRADLSFENLMERPAPTCAVNRLNCSQSPVQYGHDVALQPH